MLWSTLLHWLSSAKDNPEDFYRVNVFGTLNLLEALAAGSADHRLKS